MSADPVDSSRREHPCSSAGVPAKARTLITEEGRVTRYSTGEVEVFDLAEDPLEMKNLAGRPEGRERREHLSDRLAHAMLEYSDLARPRGASAA